jgi:chaperone required for assembly of F1-ATPase
VKKFYKLVSTHKDSGSGLYQIHLDARPVKCPSGTILGTSSEQLAQAIVGEWSAQGDEIIPDTMPLMQILTTQQDRVSKERAAMAASLYKYFDTDLLCYRAPKDDPPGVAEAQSEAWDTWLDWFEKRFGERLHTTDTLVAVKRPKAAHDKARAYIEGLDDAHFTALQLIVSLSGSLVLGLAALEGEIAAQQVFDAAHVEEYLKGKIYNEEFYGPDPLHEKTDAAMIRDLKASEEFLRLL